MIHKVLAAAGRGEFFYVLLTHYRESDAINPIGQVARTESIRGGKIVVALGTDDPLSALWVAPSGEVWTGAANGAIWTTAVVPWPEAVEAEPTFQSSTPNLIWRRTGLPALNTEGYSPNVSCFWGDAADNLFAGTFQGAVYAWNGMNWSQTPGRPGWPIIDLHGAGRNNVYAVGRNRNVAHFNGAGWTATPLPEEVGATPVCPGVRLVDSGDAYVCTRSGFVLRGNTAAFTIVASAAAKFSGLALLEERIVLASDVGAWELAGSELRLLKPNFHAIDICEAADRLFFIESSPEPGLRIIEYDPRERDQPWVRREFALE